jgi:CDP-glucose 4,6-dehydratase
MNKKFWKKRNIFITGSTGLLGSWITKYLVEAGANVTALIRKDVPKPFLKTFSKVKAVKGSITDYEAILAILKKNKIEAVFHLAAQTISPIANKNPLPTFETNIKGVWVILEACRNTPSVGRIIIPSSDKAYGEEEKLPYTEESKLTAKRPYTVSKSCADLIAQAYIATYDLPVGITRCGNFFGGGDLLLDRLVPSVIKAGLLKEKLIIRSDGKFIRDFLYVEDGARATIKLAEMMDDRRMRGQAFNFSYEKPITVLGLVNIILRKLKSPIKPKILGLKLNEVRDQYLSSRKAIKLLKWKPTYTFDQGLNKTIKWYKDYFRSISQEK